MSATIECSQPPDEETKALVRQIAALESENKDLKERVESLEDELKEGERELDSLRANKDNGDLEEAIGNLLDAVERPIGTLKATLPQTPASERALVALYDAIGRNL